MTINKAWFQGGNTGFSPAGIVARLRSAIKLEIPTGYQDETGFHLGVKADEKEVKWPVAW